MISSEQNSGGAKNSPMLSHIRIRDFAIIEDVEIDFAERFTVITGETGAGKSILLQAITLLLGARGDTDFIRNKSEELSVEGVFSIDGKEILIKRFLNRSGRSKIYIDGEIATLNQLNKLAGFFVDISSQHQHQLLLNEDFHTGILDSYLGNDSLLAEYRKLREEFLNEKAELDRLRSLIVDKDSRLDFLRFQRQELSDIAMSREEYNALLDESNILKHGSRYKELLTEIDSILYSGDNCIVELLGKVKKRFVDISSISKEFEKDIESISSAESIVSDIAHNISSRISKSDFSYERLDEIEGRLLRVKRVCEKYRMNIEEIRPRLEKIEREIEQLENSDIITRDIEKRLNDVFERIKVVGEEIYKQRKKASKELIAKCEETLKRLGFRGSKVEFEIAHRVPESAGDMDRIQENGFDRVRILFAPNVGEDFKPLSKIASGGELSRVMLAFKNAVSGRDVVDTYIFDEVDAGIGGAVAESVGLFLKDVSKRKQVICITHLPQIASLANEHLTVEKIVEGGRTVLQIRRLSKDERVEEIARMLGGHRITEKNRAYAKELLERNA